MRLIISGVIILCFLSIPMVFAELDLSNQRIISNDGNVIIEFRENTIKERLVSTKIIPNIDFGIIELRDQTIFLDDTKINVLANSFRILSYNPTMLIYAQNLGNDEFNMRVYTYTEQGTQKQTFTGIMIPINDEIKITNPIEEVIVQEPENENIDILMTGKYSYVTALKDTIILDFRFFDSKLNPNKDDALNYGTLDMAEVSITIVNPSKQNAVEWSITGETNKSGHFETEFRVPIDKNLIAEYEINILLDHQGNVFRTTLPMFVQEYNADQVFKDVLK